MIDEAMMICEREASGVDCMALTPFSEGIMVDKIH